MLHKFLSANREQLISQCKAAVARRTAPVVTSAELHHGIALFLDQLIETLRREQGMAALAAAKVSGPSGGGSISRHQQSSEIGLSAATHGRDLLAAGFPIDQVVHHYGDLCQAITGLAQELNEDISVDEFRTLNQLLDNAIADAVIAFAEQWEVQASSRRAEELNQRLGFLAHELRNLIQQATLAVTAMRAGHVGLNGATGDVLDRSLVGLRNLIDRSLSEVRVNVGMALQKQLISISEFISEIRISASLEGQARQCAFMVTRVDEGLEVMADRDLLFSAVGNLLQNAFKYTHARTQVSIAAYAAGDRVLIEVADRCGGLSQAAIDEMFMPFKQHGANKSGLGLGLAISRRSIEANQGLLNVRDVPGVGCVFTIDLPRHGARAA